MKVVVEQFRAERVRVRAGENVPVLIDDALLGLPHGGTCLPEVIGYLANENRVIDTPVYQETDQAFKRRPVSRFTGHHQRIALALMPDDMGKFDPRRFCRVEH